jgi:hypothetical protein
MKNRTFKPSCNHKTSKMFIRRTRDARRAFAALLAYGAVFTSAPSVALPTYNYIPIDFPGAISTTPFGINSKGQIVGTYFGVDRIPHAFITQGDHFITIDPEGGGPGSAVSATAINDGGVALVVRDGDETFLRHTNGTFTPINGMPADTFLPTALSVTGKIVGTFRPDGFQGFIKDTFDASSPYTAFNVPGPPPGYVAGSTQAYGISSTGNYIVGQYGNSDGGRPGYILDTLRNSAGVFTVPGVPSYNMDVTGVDHNGWVVGQAGGKGFLLKVGGEYAIIDPPSSNGSLVTGIADSSDVSQPVGNLVGITSDTSGFPHGFLATPCDFKQALKGGISAAVISKERMIDFSFTPGCGLSLKQAAKLGGYDHFNWLQEASSTVVDKCNETGNLTPCHLLEDRFEKIPSGPLILDSPKGGFRYQAIKRLGLPRLLDRALFPAEDDLPWYLDYEFDTNYRLASNPDETQFEQYTNDGKLSFNDKPCSPAGDVKFKTRLAGVRADGSGEIILIDELKLGLEWNLHSDAAFACGGHVYLGSYDDDFLDGGKIDVVGFLDNNLTTDEQVLFGQIGVGIRREPPGPFEDPEPSTGLFFAVALIYFVTTQRRRDWQRYSKGKTRNF